MFNKIFVIILFSYLTEVFSSDSEPSFYTIVAPSVIRPHTNYTISASVHDSNEPIEIKLSIVGGNDNKKINLVETTKIQPHTTEQINILTNDLPEGEYKLLAEGLSGKIFKNETDINLVSKTISVLIQTDKAIYKPGDAVRYRIFILDAATRPAQINGNINIYITDGSKNRIKQWKNVKLENGIFSNELQLSSHPVLGEWLISAEINGEVEKTKIFEVAEYVLPKFDVTIDSPGHPTYKDGIVRTIVRSKYTFGKPVKGEATVTLHRKFYGYISGTEKRLQNIVKLDGKAVVEFKLEELHLDNNYDQEFEINAIVEEDLTGKKYNASITFTIHKFKYSLKVIERPTLYTPNVPIKIIYQVVHHDGSPVRDSNNQLTFSYGYNWREENYTIEKYSLDNNGFAEISLTINDNNQTYINTKAEYLGIIDNGYISKIENKTGSFIEAEVLTKRPKLNENITVIVRFGDSLQFFTYQILGRGKIIATDTVPVTNEKSYTIEFKPTLDLVPTAKMVIYYFKDGEIVSTTKEISIEKDLENFIKLDLSESEAKPGDEIRINVTSSINSHIGLLGVDQSVLLLKSGNDLTSDEVFNELDKFTSTSHTSPYRPFRSYRPYSNPFVDFENSGAVILTNANNPIVYYEYYDIPLFAAEDEVVDEETIKYQENELSTSNDAKIRKDFPESWIWNEFTGNGGVTLMAIAAFQDNLISTLLTCIVLQHLDFRVHMSNGLRLSMGGLPGISGVPMSFEQPRQSLDGGAETKVIKIRSEFQETWLWENTCNSSGNYSIVKHVPDTITSWVLTGFALSPEYGLGLTKLPSTIRVFQPFFISLNLPYSIKRGEVVSIPIIVFNYLEKDLLADVTLYNDENEFEFEDVINEIDEMKIEVKRSTQMLVKSNDAVSVSFIIAPKKVGQIKIKVTATTPLAGDGVERLLNVEPEGITQFINKAAFIDLRESNKFNTNLSINIPEDAVPDSVRLQSSVVGDLLGGTIKNLDSLIRMPYGCGEQNMLNFVPNIVVIDYLKNLNQLTEAIETRAKKYMEAGYQRELTYKHDDGSFSAFGKSDKNGSTWLTAFVAKSFRQAAKHILIEDDVIGKALIWLKSIQATNGSFPEVGHVSHKDMQGGAGSGIALTAYTLISFLENQKEYPQFKDTIDLALNYIIRNINGLDDLYSLSLAAYALQLSNHNTKSSVLQALNEKAIITDGITYWKKPVVETITEKSSYFDRPNSVNVEMTAYGLLTYLQADKVTDAVPIMKWLLSQRNDQGGFQSTQDTVVGLQALAGIAQRIATKDSDINILVKPDIGGNLTFNVNNENSIILQTGQLPENVRNIDIETSGKGFALFQLSYSYNLNKAEEKPQFTLESIVANTSTSDHLILTVCTSLITSDYIKESNMAVMEVSFPSGYTADLESLSEIESIDSVKRVETKDGDTVIVVYFDNLTSERVCPTFNALRTHKVAKQKPAPVTVYDYYDNTRRATIFYETKQATLCDICEDSECIEKCLGDKAKDKN